VRAHHRPTGLCVFINGRDQYRNKQLALEILTARVLERDRTLAREDHSRAKAAQIGYGDRSGKIRTYNFVHSYVLNHHNGRKTHRIDDVINGRLDLVH
jgi:peptide chain release factor 1